MLDNSIIREIWDLVYNLSLNMLHNATDAEDATQSIIEKVIINYSSFKRDSKVTTWAYRIAYNYLIDQKRLVQKEKITFEIFEEDIKHFEPYQNEFGLTGEEERIFAEEVKVGCTLAMLQCLDPENRFAYILGGIFNFNSVDAAEVMNIKPAAYRKKISRAKEKVKNFMQGNCGLVNPDAFCQCRKRLLIAKNRGRINFDKIIYQTESRKIKDYIKEMNEIDSISQTFRNNPFFDRAEQFASYMNNNFEILQETKPTLCD
jgi:RNA polymerase sigma factor (sigma-70 family)